MCGISGIFQPEGQSLRPDWIKRMLTQIQYRGPDESGIYIGEGIGLGSVRLSIIDLAQGQQPMSTKEEDLWIVYNGEIFNYIELREDLKRRGYQFRTDSDTEVLLLLYKEYREKCVEMLNGQFVFAIWDPVKKELFMARDRMGIRPLYYFEQGDRLIFGSEIKCLTESGFVETEIDPAALNQVFTFWTIPSPGTLFKGIKELPPGHYMIKKKGVTTLRPYWQLAFHPSGVSGTPGSLDREIEEFESLIMDSIKLRLRSDVQVAAYLSGGIDSSATTYFIKKVEPGVLNTFSIGFEQSEFDETSFQQEVSGWLDTSHSSVTCFTRDIAANFAEVLWHTEIPLLRTGSVPMFLLSNLVHEHGIKVVITGEGADEFLGGYNIFKEALIREFWSRQPDSRLRPLLLQKLYPYLAQFQGRSRNLTRFFFGYRLSDTGSPVYSHLVRWNNSQHVKEHFSPGFMNGYDTDPSGIIDPLLPESFGEWDLLSRAQWLESTLFLSGYLLSSQGDRMSMAHSVEGRYPFLDHRVMEFCSRLPWNHKIKGLNEKYLLKRVMKERLPESVVSRPKQAYRAPVATSLLSAEAPGYLKEMVSTSQIRKYGYFKSDSVEKLVKKLKEGRAVTENDNMAVAGILSTQILTDLFLGKNNSFKRTFMESDCPVRYDQSLYTKAQ